MLSFDAQLEMGRQAENLIDAWLRSRGNSTLHVYETEHNDGFGPRFFTKHRKLVAPDILVFTGKHGHIYWCETKNKSHCTWYGKGKYWETGIDVRHYEQYKEVSVVSGCPTWLMFYHQNAMPREGDRKYMCPELCPTGLFGGDLATLARTESHRYRSNKGYMVYWAVPSDGIRLPSGVVPLRKLASVEQVQTAKAIQAVKSQQSNNRDIALSAA
jgi:hypothetical protein